MIMNEKLMEFFKGKTPLAPLNFEKRWQYPLAVTSLIFIFLLITSFNMGILSSPYPINSIIFIFTARPSNNNNLTTPVFVESKFVIPTPPSPSNVTKVPKLAYLVSGSKGDLDQLWRTLRALYHPRNLYVVHLDLESPAEERLELAGRVTNDLVFKKVGNVRMITKANMVTYRGPTMVANTLHACAILLKMSNDWDWFINLSASDYPLVTQDDILFSFTTVPRNINFVEYFSNLGWKEGQRAKPLIIDPGLYLSKKKDVFWVTERRELPTAFKLFTENRASVRRNFGEFSSYNCFHNGFIETYYTSIFKYVMVKGISPNNYIKRLLQIARIQIGKKGIIQDDAYTTIYSQHSRNNHRQ